MKSNKFFRVELERRITATEKAEVFVQAKTPRGARLAALRKAKELKPSSWEEVDGYSNSPEVLLVVEE